MNETGAIYVIAAYSVAALALILYEVRLWGQLQKLGRKRKERQDSEEPPAR